MPKKKTRDENEMAFDVISRTIQQAEPAKPNSAISEAARALSKLGASKGGKARAAKLSSEQRKQIARKASKARWGNKPS